MAAASLGQVYKARLRSTGEEVAVKVQRPGIADSIAVDMVLLRRLMTVVDRCESLGKRPRPARRGPDSASSSALPLFPGT